MQEIRSCRSCRRATAPGTEICTGCGAPFPDLARLPELAPWHRRADELTTFVRMNLVISHSWWIAIRSHEGHIDAESRGGSLTPWILGRHFAGLDPSHLIGLPVRALLVPYHAATRSRFMAFDIDTRTDTDMKLAFRITADLEAFGIQTLIEEYGPDHCRLICLFDSMALELDPLDLAERLASARGYGDVVSSWFPLFGRHHTADHWSRIWNGAEWVGGDRAVDAILAAPVNSSSALEDMRRTVPFRW